MKQITKLLLFAVMSMMMCPAVSAQECKKDFTPKKGDFTLATTAGYNSYTSVNALPGTLTDYEAAALTTRWSDQKLMIGFEGGWFFKDLWKLNLGGGLNVTNNPGYPSVPGTIDDLYDGADDALGAVPNYRAVANASSLSYLLSVGVDKYSRIKNTNLMWYMGLRLGVAYAQNQMKYDEYETMGKSVAESCNFRLAYTMGIDYFFSPSMYIGAQIDPVGYTYNITSYKPQEGLGNLSADSHSFNLLAAPTIKMGFKF